MPLSTDFNVPPYYDDYDETKKFYRILFRPSIPVQARELTQLQTIQQTQIERFGNHVFKDGSIVDGCTPTEFPNLDFARVADNFSANANAYITDVTNDYLLVGQTSNVRAVPIISKEGTLLNYPNTNRFYVKYLTTGANGETEFANGETIAIYNSNQNKLGTISNTNLVNTINVISTNSTVNAVGKGFALRIEDGVVYQKGFFQLVEDQFVLVRDFDQITGNTVVGFNTIEEIITENNDPSLNDGALGYENENAPGAHRLKLTPVLIAKDRTEISNNDTFFTVFEFSNISNRLVLNKTKTPYETLGDIFNTRTYEESGDYVIKPFITETIEGETPNTFAYQVSSGKGYVHGAQIEFLASRKIDVDKAMTTTEAVQQIITTNYGNFVYAKEYAGAFDFNSFVQVDLYDNKFQSITNRYSPSFAGKNKIGTASVKAVLHDSGDPGLANTSYRIYLTNISMNSGKSFANVGSIYANGSVNTFGPAYADITPSLQQSGKSALVFPFGKKALKTLRSANGTVNNNEFYYRNSSNGTLQTNGVVSITYSGSYTGGTNRIGYSAGILGDVLENQFLVVVTSNTSTNQLPGTANISSSANTITFASANSYFAPGEFVKITSGATIDYRRVTASNTSVLSVDLAPTATNTAAVVAKHFPAGYTIPLLANYPGTRQVNVTGTTTMEIATGAAFGNTLASTANVVVQYRMLRNTATQAKKDVKKDRYIKLYANSSSNNTWNLGLTDVFNLKKVYANSAGFSNSTSDDVTSYFLFDNGQRDDYYDHSKLVLKPQYVGSFTNHYLTVVVDHFTANLNNGIGFFSVDSYPIDDANTANTNAIQTAQIPVYYSGNNTIDLRDAVDFRGIKTNTANSSTTLAGATLNPATTNTFITSAAYLVEPDTNFQADIEYYLGRIDLVTLNSTGGLGVIKGTPSENPKTPQADVDVMTIARATVPPYPTLSVREAENYNRTDYSVRTTATTNRGYTMRDIGLLDKRLTRLEYYNTLNLLEQKAQNIQVPDASGLNRFKNGIFADPMTSHAFGETTDIEYRWSIDSSYGYGRPLFSSENIDLAFNNVTSTGVQLTGRVLTRPYDHELFIYQPFATKYRNNTQDLWSWKGSVELYPNYDMGRDETRLPNIDAKIDLTQPFQDFASVISQATGATIFGTRWGDWRTTSSEQISNWVPGGRVINNISEQQRSGTNTFVVPVSETIDLGKYVTDISVQPYMRSRTVAFIARNLKPNTRIYAYFDDTPVSDYCAPGALNTDLGPDSATIYENAAQTGRLDQVVVPTAAYGQPLISSSTGTLYGVFRIPEGQFRIGDRQFQLLDSDSLITGSDAALTRAAATFTASNISISSRNATITTTKPEYNQISLSDERTITSVRFISSDEPIAQSFKIEAPEEQSGVFVTKVDLFFKAKDLNLGIKVVLTGMINNYPDSANVLGTARLDASQVNISDDATAKTTFTFQQPIFLSANKEYAFYVEPEAGSPEYKMWMAETGATDVTSGAQVYSNPYTSDAFRSSNARTWALLPKEDIKFNLYVANFQVGTGTAVFENEDDEFITYANLAISNSNVSLAVGQEVYPIYANNTISNTSIKGIIQFVDTTNAKLKLDSSNGNFTANMSVGIFALPQQGNTTQANSSTLVATAKIKSIDNPVLHAIVPRFATSLPLGTNIDVSFKGTSNSGVIETSFNELSMDVEREMLDYERIVYSKSTEVGAGGDKSLTLNATLTNTNKYLSPVIDLSRKSAIVIKNIISNKANTTLEYTRYGTGLAKYVSQAIVLADGQDSEDIKVYLSAYRPYNTDVDVYVKFLNSEDSATLESKTWTKLVNETPDLRSSPINSSDYKEFVYNVPTSLPVDDTGLPIPTAAYKNVSNYGILTYTDSNGQIYNSYKTFAIKIVLTSENAIYVPKIDDIRGIALQT